jgi:polyhydroxyalkanoate synthesis repressor PhaR
MQKPGRDVLVKKYSNRRLYDTAESRYITMEELAQTIRSGRSVRVVDAKTHEDLTQQTLTQVIMESGRAGRLLPIPLLHQLIRMDDDALAEFFGRYVSWALEMYMNAKSGAQALTPLNPFATLPFAATNAFARFFAPAHEPVPAPPQEDSLADLRREIEELKQAMGKK